MTHPRGRLRSHVTIPTLDAPTSASTPPCVVDLVGTAVERSRSVSDAVVSAHQPVIEPAAGTGQPPLGSRFEPRQAFQSP